MMMRLSRVAVAMTLPFVVVLSSCSVGPDFHRPAVSVPARWDEVSGSTGVSPLAPVPIDPQWWRVFDDAELSSLIDRVAASNLDVRAATSRLRQSRAERRAIGADALPGVKGHAAYQRAQASTDGLVDPSGKNGERPYNVWQSGFDASWELDIWGRVRRENEAADASVEASADARRDVLLSVLAETARDYIQLRAVQEKSAVINQSLGVARHSLQLTRIRFSNGVATNLQVAEASSQVALVDAQLPLQQQLQAHLINALSYLLAAPPRALADELRERTGIPPVPPQIPLGLPSELAERRPDVRQAEAVLHAATADVGVAVSDFYPRITLSGDAGLQALQFSTLGTWGSRIFGVGPAISLPIFEGGRLRGTLDLRRAQQQEAAIHFQETVLSAWHEIDNGLADYAATQHRLDQLNEALRQDQLALDEAQRRYAVGLDDLQQVLVKQKTLLATRAEVIDGSADQSIALVALYKSLGGGWEVTFPVTPRSRSASSR